MPQNPETIEAKIMEKIASGRVKLRSRYVFLVERLGLGSAIVLTIVLTVLLFSLFLLYLQATDSLVYLSFGQVGLYAFLESFPYGLVGAVILLVLVGGILIRKSDVSYRKPFRYFALGIIIFVVATGIALAYTNVAEVVEEQAYRNMPPAFFQKFFNVPTNRRGISGRIIAAGDNYIEIKAPCGVARLQIDQVDAKSKATCLVGRFVVAVGERRENRFVVYRLQVIDENDVPLTGRQITRRFAEFPEVKPPIIDEPRARCK